VIFPRQFLQELAAARRAPRLTVSTGRSDAQPNVLDLLPVELPVGEWPLQYSNSSWIFRSKRGSFSNWTPARMDRSVCQLFCSRYWTSTAATGRSVPSRKVLGLLSSTPIWLDQGLRSSGLPGRCTHRPVDTESVGELVREAEVYGLLARIDPLDAVVDANSSPRCEL
jgi:hypothetical protein